MTWTGGRRPLYRRVLGDSFDVLPPVLRRFHSQPRGGRGEGLFRVTRGTGRLSRWICAVMGLPVAGERVTVQLRVQVEGGRERWTRSFDGVALETVQWAWRDQLIEASGPLRFVFRLHADAQGMRFEFSGVRLYVLPLPRFLSPRIEGLVTTGASGWDVDVRLEVPLVGMLLRYEGRIQPE